MNDFHAKDRSSYQRPTGSFIQYAKKYPYTANHPLEYQSQTSNIQVNYNDEIKTGSKLEAESISTKLRRSNEVFVMRKPVDNTARGSEVPNSIYTYPKNLHVRKNEGYEVSFRSDSTPAPQQNKNLETIPMQDVGEDENDQNSPMKDTNFGLRNPHLISRYQINENSEAHHPNFYENIQRAPNHLLLPNLYYPLVSNFQEGFQPLEILNSRLRYQTAPNYQLPIQFNQRSLGKHTF